MKYLIIVLCLIQPLAFAQSIPYGNNPSAGRYVNVGDAKIYYETYGKGEPFVLLHGGVYGGIDEFEPFITKLQEKYLVICIATRGHGKSEIGKEHPTWKQRADDAYKVIKSITKDSVTVLGFSDGGYAAYKLAALYPATVKKMIVIGASDRSAGVKQKENYTPELLLGQAKDYFEPRVKIMPEPKRWGEALEGMNKLYNDDVVSTETFSKIKCRTLIMAGDRDDYSTVELLTKAHRAINGSQLSIIPNCGHVVFYCNFPALWEAVVPFLK